MTRYCYRIIEHQTRAKLAYASTRQQALAQAINFSHDKSVWIVDEEDKRLALFRFGKQVKPNACADTHPQATKTQQPNP
jgi:hypothetical protein